MRACWQTAMSSGVFTIMVTRMRSESPYLHDARRRRVPLECTAEDDGQLRHTALDGLRRDEERH